MMLINKDFSASVAIVTDCFYQSSLCVANGHVAVAVAVVARFFEFVLAVAVALGAFYANCLIACSFATVAVLVCGVVVACAAGERETAEQN